MQSNKGKSEGRKSNKNSNRNVTKKTEDTPAAPAVADTDKRPTTAAEKVGTDATSTRSGGGSSQSRKILTDISNLPGSAESTGSRKATPRGGSKGLTTTPKSRFANELEPGKPMPKGQILFKCPKCTGPFLSPEPPPLTATISNKRDLRGPPEPPDSSSFTDPSQPTAQPALPIQSPTTLRHPSPTNTESPCDSQRGDFGESEESCAETSAEMDSLSLSFSILASPEPDEIKENWPPVHTTSTSSPLSFLSPPYYPTQRQTPPYSPSPSRKRIPSGSFSGSFCDALRKQVLTQNAIDQTKTSEYSSNMSVLRDASSFLNAQESPILKRLNRTDLKSFDEAPSHYQSSYDQDLFPRSRITEENTAKSPPKSIGENSPLNYKDSSHPCSHTSTPNTSIGSTSAQATPDPNTSSNINTFVIQCPLCSHRFCSICMFMEHPGRSCHIIDSDSLYSESEESTTSNVSLGSNPTASNTKGSKKERKNRLRRLARSR